MEDVYFSGNTDVIRSTHHGYISVENNKLVGIGMANGINMDNWIWRAGSRGVKKAVNKLKSWPNLYSMAIHYLNLNSKANGVTTIKKRKNIH